MTSEEHANLVEAYGNAHTLLLQELGHFPREMWDFKPAPREWSIHQVLVHLADTEIVACGRIRRAIAEPGGLIFAYDQDLWADRMDYQGQSAETALDLFRAIRQSTCELLKRMPESIWSQTVQHPERGSQSVEVIVAYFENHTHIHIGQMHDNYDAWCRLAQSAKRQPGGLG